MYVLVVWLPHLYSIPDTDHRQRQRIMAVPVLVQYMMCTSRPRAACNDPVSNRLGIALLENGFLFPLDNGSLHQIDNCTSCAHVLGRLLSFDTVFPFLDPILTLVFSTTLHLPLPSPTTQPAFLVSSFSTSNSKRHINL